MQCYANRDANLEKIGYESYSEYLQSDLWKMIRREKLKKYQKCLLCTENSQVVHHLNYNVETLVGKNHSALVCLCHTCHEIIEIDVHGQKRSLEEANKTLRFLADKNGYTPNVVKRIHKSKKKKKNKQPQQQLSKRAKKELERERKMEQAMDWIHREQAKIDATKERMASRTDHRQAPKLSPPAA